MPTIFKILIKFPRSREELNKDAEIILKRLANWHVVTNCPSEMGLLVSHYYDSEDLIIVLGKLNSNNEQTITFGSTTFFMLEINQLLVRMNLFEYYEVREAVVFDTLDIVVADESKGFFIKTFSNKRLSPLNPGIRIRLRQKETSTISSQDMRSDALYLLNLLNKKNSALFIEQKPAEDFVFFPAVFLGSESRSIDIAIATSEFHCLPTSNAMVKAFNQYLEHVGLTDYLITAISEMDDLNIKDSITHNQHFIDTANLGPISIPEKYLCGITEYLMDKAVTIPNYDGHLDKSTALRIHSRMGVNPFTRENFKLADIKEDKELTIEIQTFITKIKSGLEQKPAQGELETKPTPKSPSSLASDSPFMIGYREHRKLLARLASIDMTSFQAVLNSLAQHNYSEVVRGICTSTSPIAFDLLTILLEFHETLQIDINHLNIDGHSALHIAAMHHNKPAYNLLKTLGAYDNIPDSEGKTAAEYARDNFSFSCLDAGITRGGLDRN